MTLHPETQVVASRKDGDAYVYTVRLGGQNREVRVPVADLAKFRPGVIDKQQRREVLGRAVAGLAGRAG